jgi:threonine dehydrogenase-like Zn-dependent dehydrogenase
MRALVLGNHLQFDDARPAPTPAAGEILVRVLCAGVCETDLQLVKGYMGFRGVLGHEFVGVAESGPYAGRRVVGEINCACGRCETCTGGLLTSGSPTRALPTHCPHRTVLGILNHDGAFADLVAVPQRNLHLVPDGMSSDVAVFTEPVAAAFQVPALVPIGRDDRIIVLGDGRLGNLCAQVLSGLSGNVLVVGKHSEKLSILRTLGIATALLHDVTAERMADLVVDCTGSQTGLPTALALVRPRGTIVLKTTMAGTQTMPWAPFVIDEVTLVGSRCGPFDQALAGLSDGRVQVGPLVSERFDLSHGLEALERAQAKSALKVLLDVS